MARLPQVTNNDAFAHVPEAAYKVLVVGDAGVGKTSIIKRYCHDVYSTVYRATIGVDFALKRVRCADGVDARLQLWDIGGQERFYSMTRAYYKEAHGAIVVCDSSRLPTLEIGAERWRQDIALKLDKPPIPVVLAINKTRDHITDADITKWCEANEVHGVFRCSAKNNTGLKDCVDALLTLMQKADRPPLEPVSNRADPETVSPGIRSGCAC